MNAPGRTTRGVLAALLVAAPAIAGAAYAVAAALGAVGPGAAGLTTAYIRAVVTDATVWRSVAWSLWIAAASTTIATVAAMAAATLFRSGTRTDRIARLLSVLPLPVPHVVAALSVLLILGQTGLVARVAHAAGWIATPRDMPPLVYDRWGTGLITALVWKELPFLALLAFSLLGTRGTTLEEAARSLGARRIRTFAVATWPVLWRGMLPGVVAVATFVLGSYETAALLAPSRPLALPLLTMERYTDAALARRPEAFVLALIAMLLALTGVAAYGWIAARTEAMR